MTPSPRPKGAKPKARPVRATRAGSTRPAAREAPAEAASDGPRLKRIVPVLPCLDIGRAIEFYAERLGFAPSFRFDDYASVTRDEVEIHLWLCKDPASARTSGCRVEVDDIEDLYREMKGQGVIPANGELADRPWNFREFVVLDGDGNLITFAQDLAAADGDSR